MNIREELDKFRNFKISEPEIEKRYRIVADYGYGDKTWVERNLTKDDVKEFFVNEEGWSPEEYDEVGIEHFMDSDFIYYVEIDNPSDIEDWDWQDS